MRLHEVIIHGKPFRREGWKIMDSAYIEVDADGHIVWWINQEPIQFSKADILADDWEIKE